MTDQRIVSLFDVDDVASFGAVRDMRVAPVSTGDVDEFARRWHYSHGGGSALWRYGLWDGFTLVGVVAYNLPVRRACEMVFGPDHLHTVAHMGRLVCADDAPRNSESRLIGASLKLLERDKPEMRAVLTFAAQDQGHLGYVYQATNAIYTGTGGYDKTYVAADGRHISTNGKATNDFAEQLVQSGGAVARALPKHRYLYLLGNKTKRRESLSMLRLPSLPYPKEVSP
jgi:hypothetical protein